MANFLNEPSTFFMFYIDEFKTKLSIPEEFGNHYNTFLQQPYLELKTHSSSRSWAVKTKKRNQKWFIKDGWSKFATDNHLLAGNFLTFQISGESALDVSIFRGDSCMDEEPPSPPPSLRLVREVKDYHINTRRMNIPYAFVCGTGLSTECDVELENSRGRRWPVKLTAWNGGSSFSFTGETWIQFLQENNFQAGDILLFEIVPNSGNVVKVVEMEEEAGAVLLTRGRNGGLV